MSDPVLGLIIRHFTSAEGSSRLDHSSLNIMAGQTHLPQDVVRVVSESFSLSSVLELALTAAQERDIPPGGWVWFLDPQGEPAADALEHLLAAALRAEAADDSLPVGVVGAKQVQPGGHLLNVGLTQTRAGRPIPGVDFEELDQGQRDDEGPTLAVSRCGMLVRRELLDLLVPADPTPEGVMADLELGRRANLLGFRVVVAPRAIVTRRPGEHDVRIPVDAVPAGAEAPPPALRGQITHHRMVTSPWWQVPLVMISTLLGAIGRVLLGVAAADTPRGLRAAGSSLAAMLRWGRIRRARTLQPRASRADRDRVRALEATPTQARRYHRDRWYESRRLERDTNASSPRYDAASLDAPCFDAQPQGGRGNLVRGLCLVAAVTIMGWVAMLPLMRPGQVTSSALAGVPHSAGPLLTAVAGSWRDIGLGHAAASDPLLQVVIALTVLGLGDPSTGVKLLLLCAPGLAAAAGWWLASSLRVSTGWRILAALTWAASPTFLLSLAQGRLGSVLAHLGLAAAAASLICALGSARRRAAWAWAGTGGLALWVATAGAPVLALPVCMLLFALGRWVHRPHPHVMMLPTIISVLPLWLTRPAAVMIEPGLPATTGKFSSWMALLGWPQVPAGWAQGSITPFALISGMVPLLLALAALMTAATAAARGTVTVRWALSAALLGLLTAVITALATIGINASGTSMVISHGWPSPGVSLTCLGLLLAGLIGVPSGRLADQLFRTPRARRSQWVRVVSAAAIALLVLPAGGALTGWTWTMLRERPTGTLTLHGARLPAAAAALASSNDHTRVLVIRSTAAAGDRATGQTELSMTHPRLSLVGADGPRLDQTAAAVTQDALHRTSRGISDPATAALDKAFADVLLGAAPAADAFAPFGIGSVVVSGGPSADVLRARLSGTSGLLQVGQVGGMTAFRVEPRSAGGISAPDRPAALRLVGAAAAAPWQALPWNQSRWSAVVQTQLPARATVGTLQTSRRADPRLRAELDGKPLERITVDGWQQGFKVPAGSAGRVEIAYRDPLTKIWLVGLLVSLFCVTLLALPLRGTRG